MGARFRRARSIKTRRDFRNHVATTVHLSFDGFAGAGEGLLHPLASLFDRMLHSAVAHDRGARGSPCPGRVACSSIGSVREPAHQSGTAAAEAASQQHCTTIILIVLVEHTGGGCVCNGNALVATDWAGRSLLTRNYWF